MEKKFTKVGKVSHFINILRKELPILKEQYKINYLGVFGSFVLKEQSEDSDLDILVNFEETPSLFRFVNLEQHLSKLLEIKVDLVMKDSLKPNIGKHILREVVKI